MADGIHPRYPEEVVDQAAGAGSPSGGTHPHLLDQIGDVADGEEVRRVAESPDQLQLVVESLPDPLSGRRSVPMADRPLAASAQGPISVATSEFWEVHLPHAQVTTRIQRTPVGDRAGRRQQRPGRVATGPALEPAGPADLLGDLVHLLARLQEALGVDPVQVPPIQGHQPSCRVEHVHGDRVAAVGVADRVGQHDAESGPVGDPRESRRVGGGARAPSLTGRPQPVGDHLHHQMGPWHHLLPPPQRGRREVVTTTGHRRTQPGVAAQENHQVAARQELTDLVGRRLEVEHRSPPIPRQLDRRDQPTHRSPPCPATPWPVGRRQEPCPRQSALLDGLIAVGATSDGVPRGASTRVLPRCPPHRSVGEAHPQNRVDPGLRTGLGELDRTVGAVPIGQREGVHLLLDGSFDQDVRVRGAVLQGVAGGDVKVDERVGHSASTHVSDEAHRCGCVRNQSEHLLHDSEEPVGITHQIIGVTLGDHPGRSRLRRCPLRRTGREEPGPFGEFGSHLAQQHPGVLLRASSGRRRLCPRREQCCCRPQRGDMGAGVTGRDVGGRHRLTQ